MQKVHVSFGVNEEEIAIPDSDPDDQTETTRNTGNNGQDSQSYDPQRSVKLIRGQFKR